MADVLVGHQGHALLGRRVVVDAVDLAGHDVLDRRVLGLAAHEDDLAGVVALGHDADDLVLVEDDERPQPLLGHELEGLEDLGLGRYRPGRVALLVEDVLDGDHGGPS
ncbi:MAG: hypothetical protein MZV64_18230 [Ignavibacteriales bacterium]|nr:hypothetical protein [Ignavibacteriales bacterium]